MYKLKSIVGFNNVGSLFIQIISQIGKKIIILMYCKRLYVRWLTQSQLATLLTLKMLGQLVGPQTL